MVTRTNYTRTILRLFGMSWQTTTYVLVQACVAILDLAVIGTFGLDAIAAYGLVVPFSLLLQALSTGALGGAIASATGRAHSRGDGGATRRLIAHAWIIAAVCGVVYFLVTFLLCRPFFALAGGGAVYGRAVDFAFYALVGSPFVWFANLQASVLRGMGLFLAPAAAMICGLALHASLTGAIGLGLLPTGRLGPLAVPLAQTAAFAIAGTIMTVYLHRCCRGVWPERKDARRLRVTLSELRRVGLWSALGSVQIMGTLLVLKVLFGNFGPVALAAYAIAARLELLLLALLSGLGLATTSATSWHAGSGRAREARSTAVGAAAAAAIVGTAVGVLAILFGRQWALIFTSAPDVVALAHDYFQAVYVSYVFLAAALVLYHASQGAGNPRWSAFGGTARFLLCVVGGYAYVEHPPAPDIADLYTLVIVSTGAALTLSCYGLTRRDWLAGERGNLATEADG